MSTVRLTTEDAARLIAVLAEGLAAAAAGAAGGAGIGPVTQTA